MLPRNIKLVPFLLILVGSLCGALKDEPLLKSKIKVVDKNLIEAINVIVEKVYLQLYTTVNVGECGGTN